MGKGACFVGVVVGIVGGGVRTCGNGVGMMVGARSANRTKVVNIMWIFLLVFFTCHRSPLLIGARVCQATRCAFAISTHSSLQTVHRPCIRVAANAIHRIGVGMSGFRHHCLRRQHGTENLPARKHTHTHTPKKGERMKTRDNMTTKRKGGKREEEVCGWGGNNDCEIVSVKRSEEAL